MLGKKNSFWLILYLCKTEINKSNSVKFSVWVRALVHFDNNTFLLHRYQTLIITISRPLISLYCVSKCALLVLPSQSACTPVSSLPGLRRVNIRKKPFEAGLIASCMTVCGGVSTHWLYYVSHIVSDIGGSLCLSLLHYNAVLASSKCEEASQDVFLRY